MRAQLAVGEIGAAASTAFHLRPSGAPDEIPGASIKGSSSGGIEMGNPEFLLPTQHRVVRCVV